MTEHTTEERALYHTMLASRRFIELGQYDVAATIMLSGANGYETVQLSSAQSQVSKDV